MNTFDDRVLSAVDRLSGSLGPLTRWFDGFLDHLLPQATAAACTTGSCGSGYNCGRDCYECAPDAEGNIIYCSSELSCDSVWSVIDCSCCPW